MIRKALLRRSASTPGAGAGTSSSPLTPSNDAHLQSDLLNITRQPDHDTTNNNLPLPSFQANDVLKQQFDNEAQLVDVQQQHINRSMRRLRRSTCF